MQYSPSRKTFAPALAALLFALASLWFARVGAYSANDLSRLAAISAWVERGTWAINDTPFGTIDQIKVGDKYYSDKPPLMAWLGAGLYALEYRLGLRLNPEVCDPAHHPGQCRALADPARADWAYVFLTLALVTSGGAACVWLAGAYALRQGWAAWQALLGALVLGLGTGLWPYSTAFVNHVPSALGVMGAVYLLLTRPNRNGLLVSGALVAFSAALDLSCGVFALALAGYVALRFRRQVGWWLMGAAPIAALALALNYQITGTPLFPQMYTPGYQFAGSIFGGTVAGNQRAADVGRYAFDMLVGQRGLVAHFPIVLVLGAAALRALTLKDPAVRGLAWAVTLSTALYLAYFIFFTDNFGGYAYSPRWLLIPLPTLALFVAHWPLSAWRAPLRLAALAALAALSVWGGYAGARDVWRPAWPLFRLAASDLAEPPIVNVARLYGDFSNVPEALRPGLAPNAVRQYLFESRSAIVIQTAPAWWFINPGAPLAPELARVLQLPLDAESALYANLRPRAEAWLPSLNTITANGSLPEIFNQEIWLLGFAQQMEGETLSVLTAWRMENPPPYSARRAAFLHLVSAAGQTVRQDDGLGADLRDLRPDDLLLQVHRLDLNGVPGGSYTLHLGLYDPQTQARLLTPDLADALHLKTITLP